MDNISFIDVFLSGKLVGKLAMTPQSLCAFEYDADYLKDLSCQFAPSAVDGPGSQATNI